MLTMIQYYYTHHKYEEKKMCYLIESKKNISASIADFILYNSKTVNRTLTISRVITFAIYKTICLFIRFDH